MLALAAALLVGGCGVVDPPTDDSNAVPADSSSTTAPPTPTASTGPDASAGPDEGVVAEVERVIDGDSLELRVGGAPVEVRLVGINAPELTGLDGAESCNGQASRDHLRGLLDAATSIRFLAGEEDRFGRRLGELLIDGRSVNAVMVDDGWALGLWSGERPALTESMMVAADSGRGLWGDRCGPPRRDDLAIVDWQMDPPGDDRANLGDEWVTIVNDGAEPVDLDGWTIRDETTTNRFRIVGYTLGAGDQLRVRSGIGTTGAGDYHLGSDFPVWSNRGETVLLLDPEGRLAAWAFVAG